MIFLGKKKTFGRRVGKKQQIHKKQNKTEERLFHIQFLQDLVNSLKGKQIAVTQ